MHFNSCIVSIAIANRRQLALIYTVRAMIYNTTQPPLNHYHNRTLHLNTVQ